ncbi:MAG: ferritin-like domain-containing protein [Granulosicoccus sp.]
MNIDDIFIKTHDVLLDPDPVHKAFASIDLYTQWQALSQEQQQAAQARPDASAIDVLDAPGRPEHPRLVDTKDLPRRGLGSTKGRIGLLHSLAHIEFNAINLALDAVYRFRHMPLQYITEWLHVASDEGKHFLLLHKRLGSLDAAYGDLPAHDGLWDMARRTSHDVLVRMALVPRILEARGLDVAPPMIDKLNQLGDEASAAILQRIYTDEITHVEIGNRWFRYVCESRELDGTAVFRDLLKGENSGYLKSPYNTEARLQAGFNHEELALIAEMEAEYKAAMTHS